MSRTTWLTVALAGMVALGACSGQSDEGSERPSVEEVADALRNGPLPTAESGTSSYRQCVAESLVASDLSDRWLAIFVGLSHEEYRPTEAESQAANAASVEAEADCFSD